MEALALALAVTKLRHCVLDRKFTLAKGRKTAIVDVFRDDGVIPAMTAAESQALGPVATRISL